MRALWVCSRERTRRIALYKRSSIPKQNLKTLLIFLHDDTVIQLFAWCSIKTMPQITQSQVVRVTTRQWTVPLSAGVVWREEGRWHGDGTQKPQTSDPSQEGGDSIGWHLRLFQTPSAVGCWAEAAPQRLESQFVGVFTFNGNDCKAARGNLCKVTVIHAWKCTSVINAADFFPHLKKMKKIKIKAPAVAGFYRSTLVTDSYYGHINFTRSSSTFKWCLV